MTASPLTRAMLLIEELRKIDQEIPAQHVMAFLWIAANEGASQSEVINRIGVTKSGVQRIFNKLSRVGDNSRPGLDLIEVRIPADDARFRKAYLTPKGRRLIQSITYYMEG